ncbi:MAG: ATP synthase subunit B family protein [Acidimicrobiales bacterium]
MSEIPIAPNSRETDGADDAEGDVYDNYGDLGGLEGIDLDEDDFNEGEPGDEAGYLGSGQDLEDLLMQMVDILDSAKSMPLSTSAWVDRDELRNCIDTALNSLPAEIVAARDLLRERSQVLAQARREAADVLEDARAQAEGMVQRTEIARMAHRLARDVEEAAREEATQLRREADDYCDRRLAMLERALGKSLKTVKEQREEMRRRLGDDESYRGSEPVEAHQGPGAMSSEVPAATRRVATATVVTVQAEGEAGTLDLFDQDET